MGHPKTISVSMGTIPEDLKNMAESHPEVTKAILDKALKDRQASRVQIDPDSKEFQQFLKSRAFVKSIKQKVSFIAGSVPMFKTLQDISIAKALNPIAQLPLSMDLYFGISMPAFVALHIVEHTLPVGTARKAVQCTKIVAGLPFCVMAETIDRVSSKGLKMFNLPDTSLNMQGTMGVPSDIKLQDVLAEMKEWGNENPETISSLMDHLKKTAAKGKVE